MAVVTAYPEAIETHIYWDLLKNLSDTVKVQLVLKLKHSLAQKLDEDAVADVASQTAYYDILKKWNTYKGYAQGWDGEEASPLTPQVVDNFNQVLNQIDKRLLQGLTIYPETNGTLLIDSTKREAGISLGDQRFSYYVIEGDKITGQDGIPFTPEAFAQVIARINP